MLVVGNAVCPHNNRRTCQVFTYRLPRNGHHMVVSLPVQFSLVCHQMTVITWFWRNVGSALSQTYSTLMAVTIRCSSRGEGIIYWNIIWIHRKWRCPCHYCIGWCVNGGYRWLFELDWKWYWTVMCLSHGWTETFYRLNGWKHRWRGDEKTLKVLSAISPGKEEMRLCVGSLMSE